MSDSFLLDTHVWVWLVTDEARISTRALDRLESAATHQALAVSEISFWELAVKAEKGLLELRPDPGEWLKRAASLPGVGVVQVDRDLMVRSAQLEWTHRDPADRMLVATALFYDVTLATADPEVIQYAKSNRALRVLDVRKPR